MSYKDKSDQDKEYETFCMRINHSFPIAIFSSLLFFSFFLFQEPNPAFYLVTS